MFPRSISTTAVGEMPIHFSIFYTQKGYAGGNRGGGSGGSGGGRNWNNNDDRGSYSRDGGRDRGYG